jgi:hypothetical protein
MSCNNGGGQSRGISCPCGFTTGKMSVRDADKRMKMHVKRCTEAPPFVETPFNNAAANRGLDGISLSRHGNVKIMHPRVSHLITTKGDVADDFKDFSAEEVTILQSIARAINSRDQKDAASP